MRIHRARAGLLTGYRPPAAWHLLARITGATPGRPRVTADPSPRLTLPWESPCSDEC